MGLLVFAQPWIRQAAQLMCRNRILDDFINVLLDRQIGIGSQVMPTPCPFFVRRSDEEFSFWRSRCLSFLLDWIHRSDVLEEARRRVRREGQAVCGLHRSVAPVLFRRPGPGGRTMLQLRMHRAGWSLAHKIPRMVPPGLRKSSHSQLRSPADRQRAQSAGS